MTKLVDFPVALWAQSFSEADQLRALHALEQGSVLSFPQLGFSINEDEAGLLTPAIAATSKNVSLDLSRETLRGSRADKKGLRLLRGMMQPFATSNRNLLRTLLPRYDAGLLPGRISFRPAEIAGQFVLEQTWYLPVACMAEPSQSPLRILERLAGRELTGNDTGAGLRKLAA